MSDLVYSKLLIPKGNCSAPGSLMAACANWCIRGTLDGVLNFPYPTPAAPNRVQLPSEKHLLSSTLTSPQVQSFQHRTHTTKVLNRAQTHLSSQHFGFKPMKLFTTSYSCYSNILLSININCSSQIPSIGRSCAAGAGDIFA